MVIINDIHENLNEEKDESHKHKCIDELIGFVKGELDRLYDLWDNHHLSCVKLKGTLKNNGLYLFEIAETLEAINDIIEEKSSHF